MFLPDIKIEFIFLFLFIIVSSPLKLDVRGVLIFKIWTKRGVMKIVLRNGG